MKKEARDYTGLLRSSPPEALKDWAERRYWDNDLLVFRAAAYTDPLTDLHQKVVRAKCSICGETMLLERIPLELRGCSRGFGSYSSPDFFWPGVGEAGTGTDGPCPECRNGVTAAHFRRTMEKSMKAVWPLTLERLPAETPGRPDELVLYLWRVRCWIDEEGGRRLEGLPWEAVILTEDGPVRCARWSPGGFGNEYPSSAWRQLKQFTDRVTDIEHLICPEGIAAATLGTVAENSKLELYMAPAAGDVTPRFPAAYLALWHRRKNVETLLTAGAGGLLARLIEAEKRDSSYYSRRYNYAIPKLQELYWKEKRPCRVLGMDRGQLRAAIRGGLTAKGLQNWLDGKRAGALLQLPEDIPALNGMSRRNAEKIMRPGLSLQKLARYLAAQKTAYAEEAGVLNEELLADYWDMGAQGGALLWPVHLLAEHDRLVAVKNRDAKESDALRAGMKRRAKELEPLRYAADGMLIFPPERERDLIVEGKVLHHCVAGYAADHAAGKTTILLIRREEAPELPWYTLEVDRENGWAVRQNRGRRNCDPPPEVVALVEHWRAWAAEHSVRAARKGA